MVTEATDTCGLGALYPQLGLLGWPLGNGAGSYTDSLVPSPLVTTNITGEKAVAALAFGYSHGCVTTGQGVAYCWGNNTFGQLGNNDQGTHMNVPVAVNTGALTGEKAWVHLAGGNSHTCGTTGQMVGACWGADVDGRTGQGDTTGTTLRPTAFVTTPISGIKLITQSAGGISHTCVLTVEGVVYCFGADTNGELLDGTTTTGSSAPSPIDLSNW